jgi:phosphatidyl-myo-inositol alpha-mannosyltransferase
MRIALVSPYALDVVGGVQAHVLSLADALRRAGDEVLVLGPTADPDASVRTPQGGRVLGVGRTVAVPANGSRAPVALSPSAAARTRSLLRRAAPDVVHVHEPLVPVVGPAAVLATDAPVVLTFHATAEGGTLPRLYRAVRAPARRIVARGGALTAVSPVAAAFHAHMLGIDRTRLTIVPNGVDVARFADAAAALAGRRTTAAAVAHERRVVFLGRLEHRKGADVAVRAFHMLAAERPGLHLRVLGDGPLRGTLERLAEDAPADVAARLELAGRVDPADLPRLLADADVAVLPARGGESFGIVLLEAMAAGVPIVATDIPGYRAVAREGREALLVAPDEARGLADAVARILDDDGLADRLRTAGRSRALEHDWGAVAARTREVYERVRGSASGRPSDR